MRADIAPMAGNQDPHFTVTTRSSIGSCDPGGVSGLPQLRQVLMVALGVHACPKMTMLIDRELPVAGEFRQRLAFKDAILRGRQILAERSPEEKISAVDPGRMQFRLFDEFDELFAVHAKFAKARRRVHAEHSTDLAAAQMIIELG